MPLSIDLRALPGDYAVCRLPADATLPAWVAGPGFVNVSFCDDELSIVCRRDRVPADATSVLPDDGRCDDGWTALKLTGTFAFDETGVVLAVVRPLSEAGLSVFVVSTFERDYLLVRSADLTAAHALLTGAGHRLEPATAA